ncbi:extracellular solute-binding protein [Clostridium cylindrosporum]|uniref:Spermidine/putrescine-binding periplasmic protein PotD n=1 Tax=Clostridium cylindrosporum DSM 605 TaxID=1121307 RepID=A0A0J8DED5_CLOCY|nr:extracellular solute-binding protein [Clostridium cylindrosporum]KMT22584.1 spermidine/putrescine-binding periplasmic protein PotD [Clostridium cylindrosporum DSM 605]
MVGKYLKRIYTFLIYLFLYAPIGVLIIYSFNKSRSRGNWGGFSLKWYRELFNDPQIMKALYYTLVVAVSSAFIATIIGTAASLGIHYMKRRGRNVVMNLTYIPVLNADIVTGVALMLLFIAVNIPLGLTTLLLAHITFNIPYIILSVLPKLKQMDPNLQEAALDLGATPIVAFKKVVLPEIMPGVLTGALLAFTMSLDDFVISFFTTGGGVSNLSIQIYSMARVGVTPTINALSTLLFVTVLGLLLLVNSRDGKSAKRQKRRKKKSKKTTLIKILVAVTILVTIIGYAGLTSNSEKVVLNVYNWGEYIDKSVIGEFEKEYGIKVNYETFATNEDMYVKIKSGGSSYDVTFPSDYMISKMANEGLLYEIDMKNVPNYKYIDNVLKNQVFDPKNKYSVPYTWGTVGIIYNKKLVKDKVDSWDILWDKKYSKGIMMLDSQRESIGIALQRRGKSLNSANTEDLNIAKKDLIAQKPLVLAYVVDEGKDKMVAGEAAMMVTWAGDAMTMMADNKDLAFAVPHSGSNIFFDSMVIPKTSKHKAEAELFINFMTRTDISLKNTLETGYSTPQVNTKKALPKEIKENKTAYPDKSIIEKCEAYQDLGSRVYLYDRIWTEVKAAR